MNTTVNNYIEISLICVAIYTLFLEGMIFHKLKISNILDSNSNVLEWIEKPLYGCLPCMASFWTIVLTQSFDIKAILIVCGLNTLFTSVIQFLENQKFNENAN